LDDDVDENIQRDIDEINNEIIPELHNYHEQMKQSTANVPVKITTSTFKSIMQQWRRSIYEVMRKEQTIYKSFMINGSIFTLDLWLLVPGKQLLVYFLPHLPATFLIF
jgi:hypothetical protein